MHFIDSKGQKSELRSSNVNLNQSYVQSLNHTTIASYLWPQGWTYTHTHTHFIRMKVISRNQVHAGPGLKIGSYNLLIEHF